MCCWNALPTELCVRILQTRNRLEAREILVAARRAMWCVPIDLHSLAWARRYAPREFVAFEVDYLAREHYYS